MQNADIGLSLKPYLDPRPSIEAKAAPIDDSVNIPVSDLPKRVAELPPKEEPILVAGPERLVRETIELLTSLGRNADPAKDWHFGNNEPPGRLWSPNDWLAQCAKNLPPAKALDLGCGTGRDAVFLAAQGWHVQAVDILPDSIERVKHLASQYLDLEAQSRIQWGVADLLATGPLAFDPSTTFDLIFSAFFFDRDLLASAQSWLNPNGSLIVEAFTTIHQERHGKPASPARVVKPGEMGTLLPDLEILSLEEGDHNRRNTARVWARKNGP